MGPIGVKSPAAGVSFRLGIDICHIIMYNLL